MNEITPAILCHICGVPNEEAITGGEKLLAAMLGRSDRKVLRLIAGDSPIAKFAVMAIRHMVKCNQKGVR